MKKKKEKNSLLIQDININKKTLTYKIFQYFYSLNQEKKEYNLFLKSVLYFIETIQFISYSFSSLHYNSWKIELSKINLISRIIQSFRFSNFMKLLNYKEYSIILYFFLIFIFILCLIVVLRILFNNSSSKIFRYLSYFINSIIDLMVIIMYIPITEIFLIPIKCINGTVYGINNGEKCWQSMHYLEVIFGIIGSILLFIWCIFMINFKFYPFQKLNSTERMTSNNDILITLMKLFAILQDLLITNEYLSLIILLLISILIFFSCYNNQTYNNKKLEIIITMKNLIILWIYFVLLLSKIFQNFIANGFIFLFIFGCPIIIILSFIINREKDFDNFLLAGNINNLNEYINKIKHNFKLIDSFIDLNKNMRNEKEDEGQRNTILLEGNIKMHNIICSDKDCPLTKFMNNEGNFNIQKQCLLNYMNIYFNKGLKLFPNNVQILILYIQFNYTKRFNLNIIKTNLILLKNLECNIKEKFVIYCMEQFIKNNNENGNDINNENDNDNEIKVDIIEQKYQKLKFLIESSIKLYGEFWGIFSTNVSTKLNTNKLYSLGEKLNIYLNEINNLWDNELKNKRISDECQSIVQLYSKFLLEVLWDQKKSKEVYKKLNDENLNNFLLNENKKSSEENNNKVWNIEELVDNQDYLLITDSDEKGNCKIIQSSLSFSNLLGYQKHEIIGKSLEIIIPNIIIENHLKYLEEQINLFHNSLNNQNDKSYQENELNKNRKLIMVKSRMGYIFPLNATFIFLDDNDYSDSYLIKIKMEKKESKSEYAYYILSNSNLTIESISSSAINLGLTLDLLKKYVVKIDILIRTENNKVFNIYDNYRDYEEEPKKLIWVFPDIIYPKDNTQQNKKDKIEELIDKSKKKEYYIQIFSLKFNGNENIAFAFKFTEVTLQKKKKKLNNKSFIPKNNKHLIMFDLLKLCYIRTLVVDMKSGFNNLRSKDDFEDIEKSKKENYSLNFNRNKRKRRNHSNDIDESSVESDDNKNKNILTKDKLIELQVQNYNAIRAFIASLPLYGKDIILERFRPNGDKYSVGKVHESLIKIHMSTFCKRIDEKFNLTENIKNMKKKSINLSINANINIDSPKSSNTNNYLFHSKDSKFPSSIQSSSNIQGEELNKGIASDSSSTLSNIFKGYSIKYIKILGLILFLLTFILTLSMFIIMISHTNLISRKIEFLRNGYLILNYMLYTKFYVTEGILTNSMPFYFPTLFYNGNVSFLNIIKQELTFYKQQFTEAYDSFNSKGLCKEFKDFMKNTEITIDTLTVNKPEKISIIFNSAISRISSSINDLVSNIDLFNIEYRSTYELMYNLINEYYIKWENAIKILYNDSVNSTILKINLIAIVIEYFIFSIIIIFIYLKLLSKFSLEREKPINLFLTLKRDVFENLKNCSENFSNQILNKFFDNEDNEEESQQEYQSNIQPNDINIAKFKAANEINSSIIRAFSFINFIIIIIFFILLNFIYLIISYFDFKTRMGNIFQFISLYDKTNYSQSDFILSINIFKSFLFNENIPILNNKRTEEVFFENFICLTEKFGNSFIYISKTKSFLSTKYKKEYEKYFFGDISELLDKEYYENNKQILEIFSKYGLKSFETRVFEVIRYFTIKYCKLKTRINGISTLFSEYEYKLAELVILVHYIIRKWYDGILMLMLNTFYDYQSHSNFVYIIFIISLMIIIILYYSIIWKTYEEKLNTLLKGSADLINLIPQEIKNIIIEKLNE